MGRFILLLLLVPLGCQLVACAAEQEAGSDTRLQAELCVMSWLYQPSKYGVSATLFPYGVSNVLAMQLAVKHVNSANCAVLGPRCELLLEGGDGRRVQLNPRFYNIENLAPWAAPQPVRECVATNAQLTVAALTSAQSSVVASFTGGLGHMLMSSASNSPVLSSTDLYPNYARTVPNQAENMRALVHFIKHMGWDRMAIMHNQDVLGSELTEVFIQEARRENLGIVDPISLGSKLTDSEFEGAAGHLIECGHKVVILVMFENDIPRLLQIVQAAISGNYQSYTWIVAVSNTMGAMPSASEALDDAEVLSLYQGMLGVNVHVSEAGAAKLKGALSSVAADDVVQWLEQHSSAPEAWNSSAQTLVTQLNDMLNSMEVDVGSYTLAAYDAVWSVAIGIAAASAARGTTVANSTVVTGSEVMEVMHKGQFPVFQGAAGRRAFLPNGDWDLSHTYIEITNYGRVPGSKAPRHALVATVDLGTFNVQILEEERIVWANGRQYPEIPLDGPPRSILMPVLAACAAGAAMLSAFLVWRNRHLRNHVDLLEKRIRDELDLDSPLAKMLDFLRRYTTGRRPSTSQARKLEALIMSHAGSLTMPDLRTNSGGLGDMNDGIRDYLLSSMQPQGLAYRTQMRESSASINADSSSNILGGSLRDGAGLGAVMEAPSTAPSSRGVEPLTPLRQSVILSEEWLTVPAALKDTIAHDLFLDTVTSQSAFATCSSPLRLVVQQSMETLGMLPCLPSQSKLMSFAHQVEAGYPDNYYHCKLHGADVTHRMMAVLNRSGLAKLDAGPEQRHTHTVGLVAVVAAMVHDYGHPQVNNAFLVEQENDWALDFNNQAVAEHYALRQTMRMLMDGRYNFLCSDATGKRSSASSCRKRRKWFRNMVIQLVLATDMSRHFDLLSQFEARIVRNRELRSKSAEDMWLSMTDAERLLTLQIAIKVADLGHCALPMAPHTAWLQRMEEEFFLQGDQEKEAGLTPSALMNREEPGVMAPENQIGFFRVMVLPLYKAWAEVFPACAPLLHQVEANLAAYTSADISRKSQSFEV